MRLTRNIFSLLVAGSVSIFISLDVLANSPNDVNLSLENIQVNIDNGNLNRTIERLEAALSRERDPIEKGKMLGTLGNLYLLQRDYTVATEFYERSLSLFREANSIEGQGIALNNLASLELKRYGEGEENRDLAFRAALDYYSRALRLETGANTRLQTLINGLDLNEPPVPEILILADRLPPNRVSIDQLLLLERKLPDRAAFFVSRARNLSDRMGTPREKSRVALAEIGIALAEGTPKVALDKTYSLLTRATDPIVLYQGYWKQGRAYRELGDNERAKGSYRQALNLIQQIRPALSTAYGQGVIDFKSEIEPVFREFLDLLLSGDKPEPDEAIATFESLQTVEIENYFKDFCIEIPTRSDAFQNVKYPVVYIITNPDAIYFIVKIKNSTTVRKDIYSSLDLEKQIKDYRKTLENIFDTSYKSKGFSLYQTLWRPIDNALPLEKYPRLILVPDSILRLIPFNSLYDGERFLVESRILSLSLGSKFLITDSNRERVNNLLMFARTTRYSNFQELTYGEREIDLIKSLFQSSPINFKVYKNDEFNHATFKNLVRDSARNNIVHIISHGYFQNKLENSFILTGQGKLSLSEFANILAGTNIPIYLLILNACDTARENPRAFLGLAGIALKNKVANSIASLWSLNDKATSILIGDFYSYYQDGLSPLEALRSSQVDMIESERSHPYYWSSLILLGIGN
jgi:CHAT domain-containing protein